MQTPTDPSVNFRFLDLDRLQAVTLSREVSGASYQESMTPGRYVGYIELSGLNIHEINDFFIRQRVSISDCDILVSASLSVGVHEKGESESIVKVPPVVNNMLKYIDCQLTYTVCKA